jgi:hypothetical protein
VKEVFHTNRRRETLGYKDRQGGQDIEGLTKILPTWLTTRQTWEPPCAHVRIGQVLEWCRNSGGLGMATFSLFVRLCSSLYHSWKCCALSLRNPAPWYTWPEYVQQNSSGSIFCFLLKILQKINRWMRWWRDKVGRIYSMTCRSTWMSWCSCGVTSQTWQALEKNTYCVLHVYRVKKQSRGSW